MMNWENFARVMMGRCPGLSCFLRVLGFLKRYSVLFLLSVLPFFTRHLDFMVLKILAL